MSNIIIINHSIPEIGYYARTTTKGKELNMVYAYLRFLVEYYNNSKTRKAAVFIEPSIESGYPDIVIAEYRDLKQDVWNDNRYKLSNKDLKILYHIQVNKCVKKNDMQNVLGYSQQDIEATLARLVECELVRCYQNGSIRSVSMKKYCKITKLIAIEAKIDKWKSAIVQAENNIWFSTESYIMLNKSVCNSDVLRKCENYGIGIILVNGNIKHILKSEKRKFPVSHASLLFNEYIHRYIRQS